MKYPRRAPGPSPTCAISCQNSPCPDAPPRFPAPEELQFSPSLLFLLSLVYRDGFVDRATFGMLRDMLPYLGQEDARAARSLLQAGHAARELTELHHHAPPPKAAPPRCWLTQSERFLGLLEVLQKYGGQQSAHAFAQLRRYITLRDRLIGMRYGGAVSLPDIAALLDNGSTGAAAQLQQAMAMANAVSGMQGQAGLPQMLQMLSQFSH